MAVPYLTADEVRDAVDFLGDDAKYPDALIASYVSEFEGLAEQYRGVAFTPRNTTEQLEAPSGVGRVTLSWPRVRGVTLVTVDGVEIDNTTYRLQPASTVASSVTFTATGQWPTGLVVVSYQHGYDIPAAGDPVGAIVRAGCTEYVKSVAAARPQPSGREVLATGVDGGWTRYSAPDAARGRPTGWVEVDRLLNNLPDYRTPVFC